MKILPCHYFMIFIAFFSNGCVQAEPFLYPLHGKPIPFSTLKGKWVLINYWASWCESCLNEIPTFNQFRADRKHQNIALFAVNYDMVPAAKQQELSQSAHIQYPILTQDPAVPLQLGDIRGVPVTFVFNPQGQLVNTLYGEQTVSSLNTAIH